MKIVALVLLALTLASPTVAAERVTVFIFAEPDPALGGLISAGVLDSVDDLKTRLRRSGGMFSGLKVTDTRADATILVQVTGRSVVNEEYQVRVQVTLPDGRTRELAGTDVRRWSNCVVPIITALRELTKASSPPLVTR